MSRFLCLYFPNWPVQRLLHARPELRAQPIILFERDPRRGEVVSACSSAASERGIRHGMPLAEAKALSRNVGFLQAHDRQADLQALAQLAPLCEPFSPWVGWQTLSGDGKRPQRITSAIPPAELLLDITGVSALWGGEAPLAAAALKTFRQLGYHVQLGIADSIGSAWGLAHAEFAPRDAGHIRTSPPLDATQLPVGLLRIARETEDLLAQLGLERIEQLLRLPRAELPARFGPQLVLRLEQFLGELPEWVQPYRPPPQYQAERTLEYATPHRETLAAILEELFPPLAAMLQQAELGAMQIVATFVGEQRQQQQFEVGLYRPSANLRRLWNAVRLRFEQLPLKHPVQTIRLEITRTAKLESRQGELFADLGHTANHAWEELIERFSSRLGADRVLRVDLCGEVLPERAFRSEPLCPTVIPGGEAKPLRKASRSRSTSRFTAAQRPLRLHQPRPIRVLRDDQGQLQQLFLTRQQPPVEVQQQWGPERLESGWWRGGLMRRDYYRVQTTTGDRYWLFCDLRSGRWYWHGTFA